MRSERLIWTLFLLASSCFGFIIGLLVLIRGWPTTGTATGVGLLLAAVGGLIGATAFGRMEVGNRKHS
jgi:ABC-type transporter Mla maintaining outer membrane lipid asymmetry permease subunit MlaE